MHKFVGLEVYMLHKFIFFMSVEIQHYLFYKIKNEKIKLS